jgi:hypothetical protein
VRSKEALRDTEAGGTQNYNEIEAATVRARVAQRKFSSSLQTVSIHHFFPSTIDLSQTHVTTFTYLKLNLLHYGRRLRTGR